MAHRAIPPQIRDFIKYNEHNPSLITDEIKNATKLTKSQVVKLIYAYIQYNCLYKTKEDGTFNKKIFVVDDGLTIIFGKDIELTFMNFMEKLNKIYMNDIIEDDNEL